MLLKETAARADGRRAKAVAIALCGDLNASVRPGSA